MWHIFLWLTITIFFRVIIEVFFEFKDGLKDKFFYSFLIARKFLNICIIIILSISIERVLGQLKHQQTLSYKFTAAAQMQNMDQAAPLLLAEESPAELHHKKSLGEGSGGVPTAVLEVATKSTSNKQSTTNQSMSNKTERSSQNTSIGRYNDSS